MDEFEIKRPHHDKYCPAYCQSEEYSGCTCLKIRLYKIGTGNSPNKCATVCDKTGKNIASAVCTRDCAYFVEQDMGQQFVLCRE